jgi:MYXO-CTERM domain-containing protein
MHAIRPSTILLALSLVASSAATAGAQERPLDAVRADRLRIQAHLAEVEAELRAADVSHLSAEQRTARARNVERLRAYRLRGEFPHGHPGQPGPRVPTFIDAEGRACAMGQLVIESGAADVAREIAATQNHARVPEIVHPALAGWLDANGMTLAEATRVQPSYCWEECPDAGADAVCGSDGHVYSNACLATCEGVSVVGSATCDGGTCTCGDAGSADADAGVPAPDAGDVPRDGGTVPRIDGGGGGTVAPSGGCAVDRDTRGSGSTLVLVALALALVARRRRRH